MTNGESTKNPWNSLEVMKLLVSASLPILVLYFGASIKSKQDTIASQHTRDALMLQQQQVRLERVVKWRFDRYEQAAGLLNDMYAYFYYVGAWKKLTPVDIVERKRDVDKIFYSTGPVFTPALISCYDEFIKQMFEHYQGWGEDAMLRTSIEHRKEGAEKVALKWDETWNTRFTGEDNTANIQIAYKALTAQLALDLGLTSEK